MDCFSVSVFTPHQVLAKQLPAESVLLPALDGQINLLENHTHIITSLGTGILSILGDELDSYFSITLGVARVLGRDVTILARVAEVSKEIDEERAQTALKRAMDKLENKELTPEEFVKYSRKVERARLRLHLARMKGD